MSGGDIMKIEELTKKGMSYDLYPYKLVVRLSLENAKSLSKITATKGVSMNRVVNAVIEEIRNEG
jgi:predicted HicB family RNase H-like nuclease